MNIIRRALLGWAAGLPALTAMPALARAETFDEALDAAFRVGPPALAGGVATPDGLIWSGVRGVRRAASDEAATTMDRWHLGSNTKAMTAAVFARLVEQGRTHWGLTLAEVFPDAALDPAWRDVPIEAVMRHRAGMLDQPELGMAWLMTARADPRPLPAQRAALAAAALARAPGGRPGSFAYANLNYVIAGAAIEAITGGAWEDAMRAEVFGPLGLSSAGFGAPPDPNAWGHRQLGGRPTPMDPSSPGADNPAALGPAGTAHMTVADYARWTRAISGDGDWLSGESLTRLNTTTETEPAYSLGWIVQPAPPSGAFAGAGDTLAHEGSNTMWHTLAVVAPTPGLAVFTFANDGTKGPAACRMLAQRLIALTG
ncbi:serine hydrolase domain-containing protein [Brevundimonas sp.]|uniref:serine hydrolase domain-containing protein n=1 Tax=Brevundimonas sp. TaxID=1871086 RepID=UPI002D5876F7|nr:serine hydrolase domain-containing protein [Brevundimonas sp.]HYC74418.1 serine hydrolase domain-containing protein [Brevundimonas sp.]